MTKIIKIECSVCKSILYVDVEKQIVVKHERIKKKKEISLDELISKQKRRGDILETKFRGAAELEKRKQLELEEKIKKALKKKDDEL